MNSSRRPPRPVPGLSARKAALNALQSLFFNERPLYEALERSLTQAKLEPRDMAFARAIVMMVLRRLGEIDAVISQFLQSPLPVRSGPAELILRIATAELLFLDVAPHASVSSAVTLADADHRAKHFKGLINAVSRKISAEGKSVSTTLDAAQLNTPPWAWQMLQDAYGKDMARAIATSHMSEPPLDISVASDAEGWAQKLDAVILPTGSIRRKTAGRIENLPGFDEGAWWVQDAASALPAKLLGNVKGRSVIDLCAAPGGKTMQLAASGANVTAVDLDFNRMKRVIENCKRLGFKVETMVADASEWRPASPADCVLLDAPCSATGTIRRHPEIFWRKDLSDIHAQAAIQERLLAAAAEMVKPGGTLVYCVCALAPEEGDAVVDQFLSTNRNFSRVPVNPQEVGAQSQFITAKGDLRTLPGHWPETGGLDGFYAARLRKSG